MSRYRNDDNTDLMMIIKMLENRVSMLERVPRIGYTAIDTGALTVTDGDIIIEDSDGNDVIRFFRSSDLGGTGEVRFAPLGEDSTHVGSLYTAIETIDGAEQTVARFDIIKIDTVEVDGGSVQLFETGAKLAWRSADSGVEAWWQVGEINGTDGVVHVVGRWLDQYQASINDAIYPGSYSFGSGFTGVTYSYAATFASTVAPVITVLNSAGALPWNLTAQSASSFTVAWTGTLAKVINMWNLRF